MTTQPAAVTPTAEQLVRELTDAGVHLWEDDGQLRFRAPKGLMTQERISALREHREAVLARLRDPAALQLIPAPGERHEPFPATDVQAAYLLGRRSAFAYGGVACHGYGELEYDELDPQRLEQAWNTLIARHDMLRAVVDSDGVQRVLPDVATYRIDVADVRGRPPGDVDAAIGSARDDLSHRVYESDQWPLFGMRITRGDDRSVLHFSLDFLIADFVSIEVILDELHRLYARPGEPLPELGCTYRDYRLAEERLRAGARHEEDRLYWHDRLDELPAAPDLPLLARPRPGGFRRRETELDPSAWRGLRDRAKQHGVSPSCAVLAAFAEAVGAWSRSRRWSLDVTLLNRLPLHPDVDRLVGDFTSVSLLAVDKDGGATFADRARAAQAQLWQDLDHRGYSGVEVMREIGRRKGAGAALMPIVFTSAIGLRQESAAPAVPRGRLVYGISQTPQVWIDCQNIERDGVLSSNWDVREGVIPDDVLDAAFDAYARLLHRLATSDEVWQEADPIGLPADQGRRRAEANATDAPLPDGLLHDGVFELAAREPGRIALIAGDRVLTYGDVAGRALTLAARLHEHGLRRGEPVAVVMDKGWEQIVAVLAVLRAGGAYLPIDTNQPAARRARILADAGVRLGVTQPWLNGQLDDPALAVAWDAVTDGDTAAPASAPDERVSPDDLAYVIYTSGSTGAPKGVMISHRAARNTIDDINSRFGIGTEDRVLGLAALGFDLSVYDIFGTLAPGAALVLPDPDKRADPAHWAALIARHGVTLWNSVPAQLQMLSEYLDAAPGTALPSLRLALLSGDWIPVALPDRIRRRLPGLSLVSLGGATEAAIWSIHHEIDVVDPEWPSIPYGRPLANQRFHVLDPAGRPCPDGVAGELHIAGAGLAMGYLNDPERTAERFIVHAQTGERLYRTGDLGRYLPDGEIEFLGREDYQVKIRGHRIELAEIEAVLGAHPDVDAAACVVDGARDEARIVAFVEPGRASVPADDPGADALTRAQQCAAEVLAGVDRDRYLTYTRRLDDAALAAILAVFADAGLFADGAGHAAEDVVAAVRAAPRSRRLVRRWLHTLLQRDLLTRDDQSGMYRLTAQAAAQSEADPDDVWDEIVELADGVDDVRLVDYFRASCALLPELIRGEQDPLGLLFPAGTVELSDGLYAESLFNRWANAAAAEAVRGLAAGHRGPEPLRVLEVGAGAGGMSACILDALADGAARPVDYLYTDISRFFLNAAATRFAGRPGLRFAVFDIDRDPRGQGLSPNSYDLILAGDVLHASADAPAALDRLAGLLAPGGWLVAQEMTRDHVQAMTSLELMVKLETADGDFADERRGRYQTFLTREQWERMLAAAGADRVHSLPEGDAVLDEIGMRVFAARFKSGRRRITPALLERHVAEQLPAAMVPARIEVVDELPLSANGKIARQELRSWIPTAAAQTEGTDEPDGELEAELARIWAAVLKTDRVGRGQSFLDLGGDSLLAAQLAGRLLEQLPAAQGLYFDEMLRLILDRGTVANLAAALAEHQGDASGEGTAQSGGPAAGAAAAPAQADPLVELGGGGDGSPIFLVHDGTGLLRPYAPHIDRLGQDAPLFGLTGAAGLPVGELAPATLLDRLADRYAARLREHGTVRVVGVGLGARLAFEVARRLTEAGTDVASLCLVAPENPACRIEDEGLAAYLLAARFGVDPAALGLPAAQDVARAVDAVLDQSPRRVGPGALAALADHADPGLARIGSTFATWDGLPAAARLDAIADAVPDAAGDPALLSQAYQLYRTLLVAVADSAEESYADDMRVLLPAAAAPPAFLSEDQYAHWTKCCLGEVSVETVYPDRLADAILASPRTGAQS